jgi:hypothetical protein
VTGYVYPSGQTAGTAPDRRSRGTGRRTIAWIPSAGYGRRSSRGICAESLAINPGAERRGLNSACEVGAGGFEPPTSAL